MDKKIINYDLPDVISHFKIDGNVIEVKPFGSGHINDTFLIKTNTAGDYLLQKINHFVFRDVDGLMNNMVNVINHLKSKAINEIVALREVLTLVEAKDGKYYYRDNPGNYWRVTLFLADTKSYDVVTTTMQAYQGGVAFGRFENLLSDLRTESLIDTIPNFLNIEYRLNNFQEAINNDTAGRLKQVKAEVEFLLSRADDMKEITRLGNAGVLPLRITHNDTKFNNILLDKDDKIQCVIDLDTVMPGYVAYDFGDAIRSIINTVAEDEQELDKIQLNIPLFAAFTKGYLSETASFLTEPELMSLIKGVLLMPYMQAVRFLTDYLNGDLYYKINAEGHNLQRTHAQMQLFKLLELNASKLDEIIDEEWGLVKDSVLK